MKIHDSIKEASKLIVGVVLILGALGLSYYSGVIQGEQRPNTITVQGVVDPTKNNATDFTTFWEAWSDLKSKYVDPSALDDNKKLLYGAIEGLTSAIGDPHTTFFAPQDAQQFNEDISGQFAGIGAEIGLDKSNQLIVVAPLDDTPASKAGLQPGDAILQIDKVGTTGISVENAVRKIRGPKGQSVTLTISHNQGEPKDVVIIRDIIQVPSVKLSWLNTKGEKDSNGNIAYVKLSNFYEPAPYQFYQAAMQILLQKPTGVIIDLRNNPGGYLDASVQIAGWFLSKGEVVVKEEFRDPAQNDSYTSDGPGLLGDFPIVVLINKGSASASEILAGALQEKTNAIIMGETSFGKGTVQELIPLRDGSMIKITIAHWLTPDGNMIDKNGIMPDIAVPQQEEAPQSTRDDTSITSAIKTLLK